MTKDKIIALRIDDITYDFVTSLCNKLNLSYYDFFMILLYQNMSNLEQVIVKDLEDNNIKIKEIVDLKHMEIIRKYHSYVRKQKTSKNLFFRRFLIDLQKHIYAGCSEDELKEVREIRLKEAKSYNDNFVYEMCNKISELTLPELMDLFKNTGNMFSHLLNGGQENKIYELIKEIEHKRLKNE